MNPPEDHPPPDADRIPLTRLVLLLILLVGLPIVLVVLLARPDGDVAPSPPATAAARTAPDQSSATAPPLQATDASSQPSRSHDRPRARRSPRLPAPLERAGQAPPQPSSSPAASQPRSTPPAPWPTSSVTVLSWGTAVHSPWAALGQGDRVMSLAAPLDARYLVFALGVDSADGPVSRLMVADQPDALADIRLVVPGVSGDRHVSPVGRLTEPADPLAPFDTAPLHLTPQAPRAEIAVAFVVPARAASVGLVVAGDLLQNIPLPELEAVDLTVVAGTWRKSPAQRLHLRYADPILDSLGSPQHRLLFVQTNPDSAWIFEFPFTEVTASPALPGPGQPNIDVTLALGSDRRHTKARLADGGDVLILYLGENPDQRLVYRQAEH